jgi:adenosine kinase
MPEISEAMKKILVTGSVAYDTIMVFPDRFKNHLLADQLHILNVCFLTPEMRREYGGTAGNIGFNLKLLGEDALVMATVGEDIPPYLSRFEGLGIGTALFRRIPGQFTAQAFITTDLDDNQITAFHPGAMNHSHENHVGAALGAGLAIIGPDGKEGMQQHARECAAAGVPFIFDPGQGLPMFSGPELEEFLRLASYVAVNDYEGRMLEEKTGRKLDDIARKLKGLIYTLGSKGSVILAGGQRHEIPCVGAEAVVDPTGCGDAYRAGLLYGLSQGWDWPSTGRLGAVMGAIKIAQRGAQNHALPRADIEARFRKAFGYSPWKG